MGFIDSLKSLFQRRRNAKDNKSLIYEQALAIKNDIDSKLSLILEKFSKHELNRDIVKAISENIV